MDFLRQPRKDDEIRADEIRAMVVSIIKNNVTAGFGLLEQGTQHGKIISLKPQQRHAAPVAAEVYPRPFDILSNGAGKIKIHRCWFQNGSKFVKTDSEPEIDVATGVLCAIINTAANPVSVSLGFDTAYNPATKELFPVALYDVTSNGTSVSVNVDLRGSAVVFYE